MHTPPAPPEHGPAVAPSGSEADPPAGGRVRSRSRARRGLRVYDLVAAAVFTLAGVMFVAGASTSQGRDLRLDGTGGLRDAIGSRSDANAELQDQVDALTARIAAEQQAANPGPGLEDTQAEIAALAPQVGLTEVRGPGVTVSLDDGPAPTPLPEGFTGDDYLVHQEDVQGVVNALWRGGASAITVMGQRLISTSAVRCVGNTVILQGRVYSPPFVIEAVGDIGRLEAALERDESVQFFRDWSDVVGLGYRQTSSPELVLPPYTGPLGSQFAQVVS